MLNIYSTINTLCNNIDYRYIKYIYQISHKNNIYNLLLIRNKRIKTTYKDLGLNINLNLPNIFIKKRFMFNIYLDAFLLRRKIYSTLSLRYYKDRYKYILQNIKSYKFYRIIAKLPVNGQNTHSNHRTYRRLLELTPIYNTISKKVVEPKKNKRRRRGRGKKK